MTGGHRHGQITLIDGRSTSLDDVGFKQLARGFCVNVEVPRGDTLGYISLHLSPGRATNDSFIDVLFT
jgi:hypothetical protein